MTQDWDIKTRSEACGACGAEFTDQQRYFSCLTFGAEGYARADFCEPCWTAGQTGDTRHSVWNGIFRVPPPPEAETLRKETAETLLHKPRLRPSPREHRGAAWQCMSGPPVGPMVEWREGSGGKTLSLFF